MFVVLNFTVFVIGFVAWIIDLILLSHWIITHVFFSASEVKPPPPDGPQDEPPANVVPPFVTQLTTTTRVFKSDLYPFLPSKTPTDTLPDPLNNDDLPDAEKWLLLEKSKWLASEYPQQVSELVARIIKGRKGEPIPNAVCLGIGGLEGSVQREMQQFMIYSQILAQLGAAYPELLNNIVIQDPKMIPAMRALFENHGCRVVEHPEAFELVQANTFFYTAFVLFHHLAEHLKDRPTAEIGMYLTNPMEVWDLDPPFWQSTHAGLFDETKHNHEDLPCDRPDGKQYTDVGPTAGLSSFEVWWRKQPKPTEEAPLNIVAPGETV
ncbi:uncharacterized protein LY89DRAFT_773985 [Mollisia scopiformis]|uniref:SRR1-like domain-containing protein n=1 Tax=Mollisia scopiformis TaxID=149040 RepID=A0A194XHA6_MOLSC|nr:uncharacterized protein LY89DRAFT_773985 [Mollisia scopiformis]KUJ19509.1 hypothetical protein LY89DRAFT_773985 [Mollisia scopiformis]